MDLDESMNQFRIASRELFNHFFRVPDPYNNGGWELEERFSDVEALLFKALVLDAAALPDASYGAPHPAIRVRLRHGTFAPIMLNREVDSGYWDFPLREFTSEAVLSFIQFFDWDPLALRDNRYVRVRVESWPAHPEAIGKHGLVEAQNVSFTRSTSEEG